MTSYKIIGENDAKDYTPYGGAREFIYAQDYEVIIQGPADTGKTLAACWYLHIVASKYGGAQLAIVRKTQKSLYGSVLQTFEKVIAGAPIDPYGGEKPEKYLYNNGSVIWVGGMDKPDKVLSSERDIIYVNQAEELKVDDWEKLITRATGRSAVIPHTRVIGDANPGPRLHWIKERESAGTLKLITSRHTDNPDLYDQATGEITEQGKVRLGILQSLTGVRRKRLYEGIWATAEGAVYDTFDVDVHVVERDPAEFGTWYLGMDEGYTNPAAIALVGVDGDGRLHIYKEFYKRGKLQKDVVAYTRKWYDEFGVSLAAVDANAAGLIADLRDAGIPAQPHKGRVLDGITEVQAYLKVAGDGRPRMTVEPTCINTINEFESYAWKPEKDEPVKENDHILDAIRYLINAIGVPVGADLVAFV